MLSIDLKGKKAFIAGIGDDQGFGWAIAIALASAGAKIYLGTWPPVLGIFKKAFEMGKFDESRKLPDGSLMQIEEIYPLDAAFDKPEDVPEEIRENKRYKGIDGYTISEVAARADGPFDIVIHSLANGPEVKNPLLETSRKGYLSALSSSAYSFVSLVQHFAPKMNPGGSFCTLSYLAADRAVPGYGGGMSSAKAALESDVRTLAFEAGRKWGIRLNAISAGPLPSRAARAIGMIEEMVKFYKANAPLQQELSAGQVGNAAAFLSSPLASGITGETLYVDLGWNIMGCATDIPE